MTAPLTKFSVRLARWLVNASDAGMAPGRVDLDSLDWFRVVPFIAIHAGCLLVLWVGISPAAIGIAAALYLLRMFFITAFYHRYFSHRAYRTSRVSQFAMAVLGCTAGQRGPIWWAAHHREHHAASDTERDPHSPLHQGFFFSHCCWFLTRRSFVAPKARVQDWLRYRELRWLERLDWVPLITLGAGCWALGAWLESVRPQFGTSGAQLFVWGFFVSTVVLYHATYTINSLAHSFGRRRFETNDNSRNNAWLALVTLGEGWHNNHHYYPAAARQGFYWWEIDLAYLGLRVLCWLGLVRDLRPVPEHVLSAGSTREHQR